VDEGEENRAGARPSTASGEATSLPLFPRRDNTGARGGMRPNGLEMSRLAALGNGPPVETSYPGPVPSAQDQHLRKGYAGGQARVNQRSLATGPGRPGRLHRVVGRPIPSSSGARSPAGGQRAQEGFGCKERAPLAGDALQVRGQSHSVLDGPSRAYNGLEIRGAPLWGSRPASQG